MELQKLGGDIQGSWTVAYQSEAFYEFIPGTLYPAFGIALLFYKPECRLSVSIWTRSWSKNIRLYGPRKLSFER